MTTDVHGNQLDPDDDLERIVKADEHRAMHIGADDDQDDDGFDFSGRSTADLGGEG